MIRDYERKRHPHEDARRILTRRRVTAAEGGGTAYVTISLPRISMHVAAMTDAKFRQERARG